MDVVILFLNHGMASTAIMPMEIFQSAGCLWDQLTGGSAAPRFRVRTVSLDGAPVDSDGPVALVPDGALSDVEHADLIIVPASGLPLDKVLERHGAAVPWLKAWHRRGATIAGICTGVALLAEAGLLDGKQATTHWGVVEAYRQRYPRVDWRPELFTTDADGVCCGGGVYASGDLSLYLVEKYAGHEVAVETAKALLLDRPRTYQAGYSAPLPRSGHNDDRILEAQKWLRENFQREVTFQELAARLGMSARNFARRFKKATGRSPLAYLQQLRIEESKHRLEQDYTTIQEIARSVGYEDPIFFRRLFKRFTGLAPQDYRQRFGAGSETAAPIGG